MHGSQECDLLLRRCEWISLYLKSFRCLHAGDSFYCSLLVPSLSLAMNLYLSCGLCTLNRLSLLNTPSQPSEELPIA